jgi:hypothetical protein
MAITVNSVPEAYASAHDDLWYVVTSTNVAQSNFKFVFDVYVNSVQVARVKQYPDPSTNKGYFNAANIVRNYLTSYFKPNTTQTLFSYDGDDIYVSYEIKYGEEYGGTTYTNLTNVSYKAFNYYNPAFRDPSVSYFSSYVTEWLSNRDLNNIDCAFAEKCHIGWMNASGSTTSMTATVQKYSESGATVGSPSTGTSATISSYALLDLSPTAINTYLGTTFINSSDYAYGVKLNYSSTSSDEIKVRIGCSPRYNPIPVHFLNQLGSYDTIFFTAVNREGRSMNSKSYQQMNWQYNAGSTSMRNYNTYNVINPGQVKFAVEQSVTYSLKSNYLSQTNYNWIKELIGSPEVYIEVNDYYYPFNITTTNWQQKLRIADKMFNLELEGEVNQKINSQFR